MRAATQPRPLAVWIHVRDGRAARAPRGDGRARGAALLEMAIVLPFLLLLMLGAMEASRICMVSARLTNAARDGCRLAVRDASTSAMVTARVNSVLAGSGITGYTVVTTAQTSGGSIQNSTPQETITVTVSVTFGNVSWLSQPFFFDPAMILRGEAVMRSEQNPPL